MTVSEWQPATQISRKVSNRANEPRSPGDFCLVAEYFMGI